jgi:hypothetical protein
MSHDCPLKKKQFNRSNQPQFRPDQVRPGYGQPPSGSNQGFKKKFSTPPKQTQGYRKSNKPQYTPRVDTRRPRIHRETGSSGRQSGAGRAIARGSEASDHECRAELRRSSAHWSRGLANPHEAEALHTLNQKRKTLGLDQASKTRHKHCAKKGKAAMST